MRCDCNVCNRSETAWFKQYAENMGPPPARKRGTKRELAAGKKKAKCFGGVPKNRPPTAGKVNVPRYALDFPWGERTRGRKMKNTNAGQKTATGSPHVFFFSQKRKKNGKKPVLGKQRTRRNPSKRRKGFCHPG